MKYEIHGRLGLTGSGKSLDQTETDILDFILDGVEVWSCYWINIDKENVHYFNEFEEVEDLRNAVVVFDEVTDFFDPRDWENESKGVRRWFRLHRKRHLHIRFNTQDISLVAKTIGTLCHRWIYIKSNEQGTIVNWILKILGFGTRISFKTCEMSYQELKKMAVGFEIGEFLEADGAFKTISYRLDRLIHRELNDIKIELIHRYCPKCEQRQGEQIKRLDTEKYAKWNEKEKKYELLNQEFCPFCKTIELEARESGLYDTDYEPQIQEKEIKWVPMIPSPKGYRQIPFQGALTSNQIAQRRKYEGKHLENGHYINNSA